MARVLLTRPDVSKPRHVVPGAYYLITRRCAQRTFRLRPSALVVQVVAYCLALALHKTGVVLHAACVMSNHHHLVVSDPFGVLPNFLRELHRATAKALNAAHGRRENLWCAEPCSVVRLGDMQDVIDHIAYVAANPVRAGLVAKPEQWPGLLLWKECVMRITRPAVYFSQASPAALTLRVSALAESNEASDAWWRRVRVAVEATVAQAQSKMREACRKFVGRAGVRAQSIDRRATSFEPRRALVPTVAARDADLRRSLMDVYRQFRSEYRKALTDWKSGLRETVFPFGTWWMRVHHAAICTPHAAAA